MITPQIRALIERADDSHQAAKVLLDSGHFNFSAAQSYYTFFYLMEALLHSKGLDYSSHSAVMAAYGREFAKTQIIDPKFHRYIIIAERRRETGHYGEESGVSNEEARESFEWAEEFMQAVKKYLDA